MTDEYATTAERFAVETAKHEMTVLHDDGLYRHLRFMNPEYSSYWFELVTVPGALIFQGDGEAFVFRRIEDMFEFFRSGIWQDGSIHINPHYWEEKLQAEYGSARRYSMERFEAEVAEALEVGEETHPGVTEAWREFADAEFNVEYEVEAHRALHEFEFGEGYRGECSCGAKSEDVKTAYHGLLWTDSHAPGAPGSEHRKYVTELAFRFEGWDEWDLRDFDWWFLWACYGIVWGIGLYDAHKAAEAEAVPAAGGAS